MATAAKRQQLIDWLRYAADRLGWPGLVGLALGSAAAACWLAVVIPLDADNAAKRGSIATLRARLDAQQKDAPTAELRKQTGLSGDSALLPLVEAIHTAARQQNIALDVGEYVWQRESESQPARYRMIFPAHGSYVNLRAWTAALLAARPELTLEAFDLRRDSIGSDTLEAHIQFSTRLEQKS